MRTTFRSFTAAFLPIIALAILSAGCAKIQTTTSSESTRNYFNAWLGVHYPQAEKEGLGIYILPEFEKEGTGAEVSDSCFVMAHMTKRMPDGTIIETTDSTLSKQVGTFNRADWFGPKTIFIYSGSTQAGVYQALKGQKVGAERKVIVPSWLTTFAVYGTEEEYIANNKGESDLIYDFKIMDVTEDIDKWSLDSLKRYAARELDIKDTTKNGLYFKRTSEIKDTTKFKADTSIYINYTGRLLNGQVFDTTIKDTAKVWNIYDPKRSYTPVKINWGEKSEDITMGSEASGLIDGFRDILWQMRTPMSSGVGAFYHMLGYREKGSGKMIPPYASLQFEIQMTEDPTAKKE